MPIQITITAIVPEKNYFSKRASRLQDELVATLKGQVRDILADALAKRSANWSASPIWPGKVSTGARLILDLKPTGAGEWSWRWVSGGVKRHPIYPKRGKYLVFQRGYAAKTSPKGGYGKSGGYSGDTVFSLGVPDHPGIKARGFEQDVVDEEGNKVEGALAAAVARAVA